MPFTHPTRSGSVFPTLCWILLVFVGTACSGKTQEPIADPDWRYSLEKPVPGWDSESFDDTKWEQGAGGFGNPTTPGSRVGTEWNTKDIWLRRKVELKAVPKEPALYVHHDEDIEVFINGKQVLKKGGFVTSYQVIPIDAANRATLRAGMNTIAVYCHQTGGGQFVDVHLIDASNVPKLPKPKLSTSPFRSDLITRWGRQVTSENAWREYPRPQLVREQWLNLNGLWEYTITPKNQQALPSSNEPWTGKILVPFCLESKLGGVQRKLLPDESLWYRKELPPTKAPNGDRTLLHFEAVDYRTEVFLNGKKVGEHVGGNTAFSIDLTSSLRADAPNELVVRVDDDTEASQLRGKQVLFPGGIWYTQVSGIWQTVWMETVPQISIRDLKITTDADRGVIRVGAILRNPTPDSAQNASDLSLRVRLSLKGKPIESISVAQGNGATFRIQDPQLWSPSSPILYDISVDLLDRDGKILDSVKSYAGLRTVGKKKDENGHWRLTLNGEILFHLGPLDQGWWPDGLLTPPSDEGMLFDIEFLKSAGFNMIRKHIKVEPRRYYYHCDRLGMLVWQDQVSGGAFANWTHMAPDPKDATWKDEEHQQYLREFDEMVGQLENAPSIVTWNPFNEAWGQHRTMEVGEWIRKRDPSRSINIASGGNFWPTGDIADEHAYPHPAFPLGDKRFDDYVKVVGEYGGHGWLVPGHIWDKNKDNWGYGGLPKTIDEYKDRYRESVRILLDLQEKGIAAGVYTQTTDVEGEVNGLMTYDREVEKISREELKAIHKLLFRTRK